MKKRSQWKLVSEKVCSTRKNKNLLWMLRANKKAEENFSVNKEKDQLKKSCNLIVMSGYCKVTKAGMKH